MVIVSSPCEKGGGPNENHLRLVQTQFSLYMKTVLHPKYSVQVIFMLLLDIFLWEIVKFGVREFDLV